MVSALITLDSLKNRNTGLYFFAKSLGLALAKIVSKKESHIDLTFYINSESSSIFGSKVKILKYSKLHQWYFSQSENFDITHFTDQICRLPPHKLSGKKVLTIHDLNLLHETGTLSRKGKSKLSKLAENIAQCDKIVAISKFVEDDINRYFPESKGKTQVIYNGADKLSVKEHYLPHDVPKNPFLFSIGEILPKKNFHILPSLLHQNNYEIIIAGRENSKAYREKILKEAALTPDRVRLLGPINDEDKAWYYANCAAFVFPSIAEGFGLPVIEAMHFGKPVFLSNLTALPEIGADAAYYFKSFDPNHMREVLKNGMTDYETNPQRKKTVIERASYFTWERAAAQYLMLYEQILKE
ncbi:MAG TPA: glycosyltransferase family 1 protein [Pedobacter sp.]|jgi:glycosyltransferase involved in cell wall biosynthesis